MSEIIIRIDGINPVPWTSPEASARRVNGKVQVQVHKKAELRSYQLAIREHLENRYTYPVIINPLRLEFYFWRTIERYENASGRLVRKHRADATNLQKALEDAMQGIVYKNDNQVQSIESTIVQEGDEVQPFIVIVVLDNEDHVETARSIGETYRD